MENSQPVNIHAFGCSITHQHQWRYLQHLDESKAHRDLTSAGIRNLHLNITSHAVSGGAHNMQFVRYGNGIYDGSISGDDVVVWQMTDPMRHGINVREDHRLKKKPNIKPYAGNLTIKNIYTNKEMGLYTNHLLHQFYEGDGLNEAIKITSYRDENQDTIYSLLLAISGIKRTNNKLLVVFGWDACVPTPCKDMMIDFFIKNDIDYIITSIFDWTIEQGYEQSWSYHPGMDGYRAFTNEILEPRLKQLGWI
jgi:hypothetical protein